MIMAAEDGRAYGVAAVFSGLPVATTRERRP